MGKITNEFRANAGVFAIVGAGILAIGGLLHWNEKMKEDFNGAAAITLESFEVCMPTKTLGAYANLAVYVPIEAQIKNEEIKLISEKMHHVIKNFSAEDFGRNVPALQAQASATILGLTKELDLPIRMNPIGLTPNCN
jgi:hypothetical protein